MRPRLPAPAREDINVLVGHPDAVEAAAAVVEQAQIVKQLRGRPPVPLQAAVHLGAGLGVVAEHGGLQLVRGPGDEAEHIGARGVFRVKAHPIADHRPHGRVFFIAAVNIVPVVVGRERVADHGAEAPFLRDGGQLVRVVIHVEAGGDAVCQVFQESDARKGGQTVWRELCLAREHLPEQPVLQRQIVRRRAQEGHAGVRVRILEAGHEKIAAQIDLARKGGHIVPFRADVADLGAVCPDFVFAQAGRLEHAAVVKSYHPKSSVS